MIHVLMTADAVGGVWRYAVDLGAALHRSGARTTLAVMGPPPDARQRCEASRARLDVIDRPYRLEWMDEPWDDVEAAGEWLLRLEDTLEPDVVHLNGYAHASLPWSAPTVVVTHSCVRTWWKAVRGETPPVALDRYTKAVCRGLMAATQVVGPTASVLAAIANEYGAHSAASVIPNGMPQEPVAPLPRKEPLVLAAGRLWDEAKNIGALGAVAGDLPWPVWVAGSCRRPDGSSCELPAVHMLGQLSSSALAHWYRRAAIYALPARYEPFGLSVLEAAHAGCALVLGDIASLRENWAGAAVFVPPDDRAALTRALEALIHDDERRIALGRRARDRASAFTIDRTAEAYARLYRRLLA